MWELHEGDCLEIMPTFLDQCFDMILADLPFEVTQNPWDTIIPPEKLWDQYKRIIKPNGAIVLFAKRPFNIILGVSNLSWLYDELIWEKNKATGHMNKDKKHMQAHENILVFCKGQPTYNPQMSIGHKPMNYAMKRKQSNCYGLEKETLTNGGSTDRYPRTVLYFPVVNNDDPERIHPNQKPVELLQYLLMTYSNRGEVVLDNTAGSGSTGVAAYRTGRKAVLIEQDPLYCRKIRERMEKETAQGLLFA